MWYITKKYLYLLVWFWGPVLAALAVMFIASHQPKLPAPSENMTVYFSGAMPIFSGLLDVVIKKSAHVLAFGVLALLIMRALIASGQDARRASLIAIIVTVSWACLDELHQSFIPGRHPSGLDVGLDYVGAALFTLLARRSYARHGDPLPGIGNRSRHVASG